jgi:D-methionine transport system ATP-binding protein
MSDAQPVTKPGTIIRFERVHKEYALPDGQLRKALIDVNLDVREGEIFGIIGRSGAGKSTLIRAVNGLGSVSSGELWVEGASVPAMQIAELVRLRRKVGMIFQHFNLLSSRTVFENVALPLRAANVDGVEVHKRVLRLLELVGLADRTDAWPSQLSGGQKQRVGIARALVHEPRILLCDEATSALDPETTQSILELLRDINRRLGLTILLITHEMEVVRQICDRVAVMELGRIVESGPVWQIFSQPREGVTRALLQPPGRKSVATDLSRRLHSQRDGTNAFAIWSIRYDGQSRPPSLAALGLDRDAGALLVSAEVSRLHGHSYGQLVVALPRDAAPTWRTADAEPSEADIHKELLGHVDSLD